MMQGPSLGTRGLQINTASGGYQGGPQTSFGQGGYRNNASGYNTEMGTMRPRILPKTPGAQMNSNGFFEGQADNFLLPNEIRISGTGNFSGQVRTILETLESGYINCKIVARGQACERAREVLEVVKKKASQYKYHYSETKSLNKFGYVVDEVHILVSQQ